MPAAWRALALLAFAIGVLATTPRAAAQTPPSAGDIARTLPAPPALAPSASAPSAAASIRSPAPPPSAAGLQRFFLKQVRFAPTAAIDNAELQAIAAPYLNRDVDPAELNALTAALQQRYQERGLALVALALPSQDVTAGVLVVAIVEPKLGRISIVQGGEPAVSEARALGLIAYAGLAPGRPLDLRQLDRAMFALNDLPGVGAKATLTPSGDEGVFDLVVETEARRAWDLALDLDNHGAKSTGTWRAGGLGRWNNPLHLGDNLDLRVLGANHGGLTLGRLAYELPVGYTPWRASLGVSRIDYQLGGTFAALEAKGVAVVSDAAVSYPVIRSRTRNLIVRLGVENKDLEDRFDALGLRTDKRIRDVVAGASFEDRDTLLGGGYNGGSAQLESGSLRIDTANVRAEDAALGNQATQGGFTRLNAQLSRLQTISDRVLLYVGATGQWASKNLDGAEKLTLGGATAVRAYPAAEAPSDQGVVVNGELRYFIDPSWTVFALYDWGKGKLRKRPDPGSENTRVIDGSGIGVYFSDPRIFTLKASLAWRGRDRPQSEAGNDSPRFYVQVQRPF
jgi:hemolysin activation/secretion protein